jgi:signal transduction histidine kinase
MRGRSRLRRLWPGTLRLRLTLLTALIAAIPLTTGAALGAVGARSAILTDVRQRHIPPQKYSADGHGHLLLEGKAVPKCIPRVVAGFRRDGHKLDFCFVRETRVPIQTESGDARPVATIPKRDEGFQEVFSDGRLSLAPWTDTGEAPGPIELVTHVIAPYRDKNLIAVAVYPLREEQARLNAVVWSLAGGALGLTLLIAAGTWIAVGRVLRPVEAIRSEFAELSAHHLDRRVTVPRAGTEIARLAATMNTTLQRLETTVDQQRQFVADASHELRTPLACLRTELELAANDPRTADWPRVVTGALGDAMRLQNLTESLLLLARLDARTTGTRHEELDLADVVRQETARRRPSPHLTITTETPGLPVAVHGHHALLGRVLGNLLDNAERHAASTVTVRLTHDRAGREAVLDVIDDGPGIPPEHRQRIFERFTRLDDARARDTGGAGLGLAIAHRVTTTHHGTLTLNPTGAGAHFTLRLPT